MQLTWLLKAFESNSPTYSGSEKRRHLSGEWRKLVALSPHHSSLHRISAAIGATAVAATKAVSLGLLLITVLIGTVGAIVALLVLQIAGKKVNGFEHRSTAKIA